MKIAYGISGIAFAVAAISIGVFGMSDVMWLTAILAALFLFAANVDRVSKLRASFSGIEAETRAIIDEAKVTIEQMRLIAKIAAKANLSLVMRSGRLGGYSADERETILKDTMATLKRLGVNDKEVPELLSEWHFYTRFDYMAGILGNQIPSLDNTIIAEWKELRDRWPSEPASADELQAWLVARGFMTDHRKELLEDYRYYSANQTHRRHHVWRDRANWPNIR